MMQVCVKTSKVHHLKFKWTSSFPQSHTSPPESVSPTRGWRKSWLTWSPSWARSRRTHPGWSPPPPSCRGSRQSGACCEWACPAPSPQMLPSGPLFPSPPHLQPVMFQSSVPTSSISHWLTGNFLLYQVLEVPHAAGVTSGATVFYIDWGQHPFSSQPASVSALLCTALLLLWLWLNCFYLVDTKL